MTGRKGFFDRMKLVEWLTFPTIAEGWKEGFGPQERPYSLCARDEFFGFGSVVDAPF